MTNDSKFKKRRFLWSLLLFLDVLLFIEALSTGTIWACLVVMVISEIIYFKGNKYLFGEFDAKRKREEKLVRQKF